MKLKRLYFFTIFILYIVSMQPWFVWNLPTSIIYFWGAVVSIVFAKVNALVIAHSKKDNSLFLLLTLGVLWLALRAYFMEIVGYVFLLIVFYVFLGLRIEYKRQLLEYIKKLFSILLLVSLVFYFAHLAGVPLPSVYSDYGPNGSDNYFLFVLTHGEVGFERFRSIFGEPGFLTLGIIPLFFASGFNLRDKNLLILLIAELVSFSLAGYFILFIAMAYYCFYGGKFKKYARMFLVLLITTVTVFISNNRALFEIIDTNLLARIAINDNTGKIAGFNRSTEEMDYQFDKIKSTSKAIYGLGPKEVDVIRKRTGMDDKGGNAGIKIFVFLYGYIGVFLFVAYYFKNYFLYRSRDGLIFLICLLLLMYQNCYVTWYCVLIGGYLCFMELHAKQKNPVMTVYNQQNSL